MLKEIDIWQYCTQLQFADFVKHDCKIHLNDNNSQRLFCATTTEVTIIHIQHAGRQLTFNPTHHHHRRRLFNNSYYYFNSMDHPLVLLSILLLLTNSSCLDRHGFMPWISSCYYMATTNNNNSSSSWEEQQEREKREEWSVELLNRLLDAHPRSIRTDSEGGRLPLHTAIASNATPRIMDVLLRS